MLCGALEVKWGQGRAVPRDVMLCPWGSEGWTRLCPGPRGAVPMGQKGAHGAVPLQPDKVGTVWCLQRAEAVPGLGGAAYGQRVPRQGWGLQLVRVPRGARGLLHQASLLLKEGTRVGGGYVAMCVSQLSARLARGAGALLPPRSGVHPPVQAVPPKPCLRCLQAASPTTERFRQRAAAPASPARPPRRWASSAPAPRLKRRRQRPKVGEGLALPAASPLINLHPPLLHPRVPFAPLSASSPYRPVHLMRLCCIPAVCAASAPRLLLPAAASPPPLVHSPHRSAAFLNAPLLSLVQPVVHSPLSAPCHTSASPPWLPHSQRVSAGCASFLRATFPPSPLHPREHICPAAPSVAIFVSFVPPAASLLPVLRFSGHPHPFSSLCLPTPSPLLCLPSAPLTPNMSYCISREHHRCPPIPPTLHHLPAQSSLHLPPCAQPSSGWALTAVPPLPTLQTPPAPAPRWQSRQRLSSTGPSLGLKTKLQSRRGTSPTPTPGRRGQRGLTCWGTW